jgi:hypothetical protein
MNESSSWKIYKSKTPIKNESAEGNEMLWVRRTNTNGARASHQNKGRWIDRVVRSFVSFLHFNRVEDKDIHSRLSFEKLSNPFPPPHD